MAISRLEVGYLLDAQWHLLRREMEETPDLREQMTAAEQAVLDALPQ